MPSDESKGHQLDAIGSLAQRQLDNTPESPPKGMLHINIYNTLSLLLSSAGCETIRGWQQIERYQSLSVTG